MYNKKLKVITSKDFKSMFSLMNESFPNEERRSYEGQEKIFNEKSYKVVGDKDNDGNVTAFIATWEFDEFNFIEHFAVNLNMRGKGIGTILLKNYINKCNKPIFLEVEHPNTEIAIRRIEFYKRLGFYLNDFDYVQPPLQKGNDLLPLKIMSYPSQVNKAQFINYKDKVYNKVYKVKL